jgi:hypothetical protein
MDADTAIEIAVGFILSSAAVLAALVNLATSTNSAAKWFQRKLLEPVMGDTEELKHDVAKLVRDQTEIYILGESLPMATRINAAKLWLDKGYDGLTAVRAKALIDSYSAGLATGARDER